MKKLALALCAASAAMAFGSAALADDAPTGPTIAFNAGVANEYIFRGVSQSAGDPQIFAGADLTYGQVYAGVWSSNVEFGDGTNQEFDIYGGWKPAVGPVSLDLGVIYYGYIRDPKNDEDYWEVKVAGSVPIGQFTLGGAVFHSPEFPLNTGAATYYEVNGSFPIDKLTVSGALGHQDLDQKKYGLDGFTTWNIGATYPLSSKVTIDGRYIDTDSKARNFFPKGDKSPFNTGSKFIVTLKASF